MPYIFFLQVNNITEKISLNLLIAKIPEVCGQCFTLGLFFFFLIEQPLHAEKKISCTSLEKTFYLFLDLCLDNM